MRAKYYPGLFAQYEKRGRGWIKAISPEDLQVFIRIGFECSNYGRDGGKALANQRGNDYMRHIGRIGAISANSKRAWIKAMQDEMERLGLL